MADVHPLALKEQWTAEEGLSVLIELREAGLARKRPDGLWTGTERGADLAILVAEELAASRRNDELLEMVNSSPLAFLGRIWTLGYRLPTAH